MVCYFMTKTFSQFHYIYSRQYVFDLPRSSDLALMTVVMFVTELRHFKFTLEENEIYRIEIPILTNLCTPG